jgi:hypothetical protein
LDLAVHNSPQDPVRTGEAIGDQVLSPCETIQLEPSEQFPRQLILEWDEHGLNVILETAASQILARSRAAHADVMLVFSQDGGYRLWAGKEPTFKLSAAEFEVMRAKLEPRGVRVWTP